MPHIASGTQGITSHRDIPCSDEIPFRCMRTISSSKLPLVGVCVNFVSLGFLLGDEFLSLSPAWIMSEQKPVSVTLAHVNLYELYLIL